MNLNKICDGVIRWSFYLLAVIVPLILTPWNYELFEFNKMVVTYALTAIITTAWVVKMVQRKQIFIAKTPLDIPIGLFLLSQFISTIFSIDPHISWLGYYSRFNGGMWSLISYTLLYYAFVTNMKPDDNLNQESGSMNNESKNNKKHKNNLIITQEKPKGNPVMTFLKILLATASVVAFYGLLERLGIDKNLWVQDVQNRVFSTLGQPNWLAAYLVALIPLASAYVISSQTGNHDQGIFHIDFNRKMILWSLISALFFFVLLCTRSRSGLLGLAVAEIIFWGAIYLKSTRKKLLLAPFGIIHLIFFLIVFFNGSYVTQIDNLFTFQAWSERLAPHAAVKAPVAPAPKPSGTLLEYGGTESGTIREYVWEAALTAWRASTKNFLIGTGTETFAWTFFQYRPVGHNMVSEWDFLYNKAHNEYLNYLATTGIFGLGSYILLIGVFIFSVGKIQISKLKNQNAQHLNRENNVVQPTSSNIQPSTYNLQLITVALFAGWTSILVTNFFGFSVVIVQILFFLFPAVVFTLEGKKGVYFHLNIPAWLAKILGIVVPLAGTGVVIMVMLYWYADTLYAKGYRLSRAGMAAQAQPYLEDAISINPGEPNYHDELANVLSTVAYQMAENKDATGASEAMQKSVNENTYALTVSPNNVNFWKTRTKIFYALSSFDTKFIQEAIDSLTHAYDLSPNDPKIIYNLGILYSQDNKPDKALALMQKAKQIKPNYRDAYYGLYVLYKNQNKLDKAKAELTDYLTKVDPKDQEFQGYLNQL